MDQSEREAVYRQRMAETIKLDPKVPFQLNGTEHILVFNNRAVKQILAETGINLLTTPLVTEQLAKPEIFGAIVYWGLKTNSPNLTPEDVDLYLTTRHLLYYQTQIAKGLELFYPDISDLPIAQTDEEREPVADPT